MTERERHGVEMAKVGILMGCAYTFAGSNFVGAGRT